MLKAKTIKRGALLSKGVQEVQDSEIKRSKKDLSRLDIQDTVFDNADSIADNAKMISLLLTTISRMYDIMEDTQKDKLSTDDRNMIEYTFSKFASTNTRADIQFATEGVTFIDKLLNRQAQIGAIIGGN